jgi:hypothetical protein
MKNWWSKARRGNTNDQRKKDVSWSVYTFWQIWKERGRRIFHNMQATPEAVAQFIRADLELLGLARETPGLQV